MLPFNPRSPTYDLETIQWLAGQGALTCFVSQAALAGGDALNIDRDGVVEIVLLLEPTDFHKTMEALRCPGLWQDVYHHRFGEIELYIKLQIDHLGRTVVIHTYYK